MDIFLLIATVDAKKQTDSVAILLIFYGVLGGFFIGLLVDITPMVSYFGISPLTYSLTGFFSGYLQNRYNRVSPFVYHSSWIILIAFHFLIF